MHTQLAETVRKILVTGATSVVGRYLVPRLAANQCQVLALSRRQGISTERLSWYRLDMAREPLPSSIGDFGILIHLAPLPLLAPFMRINAIKAPCRVIAIGTTSLFTKSNSRSVYERRAMEQQRCAEENLMKMGMSDGIRWTLFRPTLVYDGAADKNVAKIVRFIRRFHFFPVVPPGSGLRQPLHADDLAWACTAVIDKPLTELQSYNLAGSEVLRYKDMVKRVFELCDQRPRILPIPVTLYRTLLYFAGLHSRYRYLVPAMADRINQDMVFDYSAAQRDFGFSPRPFAFEKWDKQDGIFSTT